ncbi:MAG: hypothetical protein WC508_04490 [Patescibacteria group bacterium]
MNVKERIEAKRLRKKLTLGLARVGFWAGFIGLVAGGVVVIKMLLFDEQVGSIHVLLAIYGVAAMVGGIGLHQLYKDED